MNRHLLSSADLTRDDVRMLLATASEMHEVQHRDVKKLPTLRGRTVINLFFEDSTRTRSSFEIAGKWMSADTINITGKGSSASKGESLRDTVRTIDAMSVDAIVIRHMASGAAHQVSQWVDASVVNAGDGTHEHPTQALLDAYTMRQHKKGLRGLRVAIVGDIAHSRVVRSNIHLLKTMGADVVIGGPATLLPRRLEALGVEVTTSLDAALEGADVVMMLRVQLERQKRGYFPTIREYFQLFGLTEERLKRAKPDAIVMHPGPINRGVELSSEVADGPRSVILEQVTNGVAVRMAVLYLLAGGGPREPLA
jgi:aspartate carbamoyltransferase catalytic subunit